MSNDFLRRMVAVLDEALKPLPPVDYNAEFAKQLESRTTSLTVHRMAEEPRE